MKYFHVYFGTLKRYWKFDGRASRKELWSFFLVSALISFIIANIDSAIGEKRIFTSLYALATASPAVGLGVRRFHDTNRSGLWSLIIFVPVIGWILYFYILALPGDKTENRYGLSPDPGKSSLPQTEIDLIIGIVFIIINLFCSLPNPHSIINDKVRGYSAMFCLGYLLIRIIFGALKKLFRFSRIENGLHIRELDNKRSNLIKLWGVFLLSFFIGMVLAIDMNSNIIPEAVSLIFIFLLFPFWILDFIISILRLNKQAKAPLSTGKR